MNEYGFIILAAGASSRLGRPKQLLPYNGKTLIENSISCALETGKGPAVVVLGAYEAIVRLTISYLPISIEVNTSWEQGMGSSICCGMNRLLQSEPEVKGVIIMVADQPYISRQVLTELIAMHHESGKPIVASYYNNTAGVPAFFATPLFPSLMNLKNQEGAKKIILSHPDELATISFEKGNIDIDTESAYAALLKENIGG